MQSGALALKASDIFGPGMESGEFLIDALGPGGQSVYEFDEELASGPPFDDDEASEMMVGPFSHPGSLVSTWSVAARAARGAASTMAAAPAGSNGSDALGSSAGEPFGRFRAREVLGEGRHAIVYRAYDAVLDRDVALKVPRAGVLKTTKSYERFLGEARAQAHLRHPRIVPVYEAGRAGERPYIAMALIEGRSLADLLKDGPVSPARAAAMVADLAEALDYAHDHGVVHRDVKPANVRVDARGEIHLMDFGIAYRPDSDEVPVPPGAILGTPAYVAPEQAQGGRADVLPASDQYSLGVVLYELLCGRPPFVGPLSYVLFHTIHHDPPSPCAIAPGAPRALAAICLKCLAKRPDRRYANCRRLADELRAWLHDAEEVPAPSTRRARSWFGGHGRASARALQRAGS